MKPMLQKTAWILVVLVGLGWCGYHEISDRAAKRQQKQQESDLNAEVEKRVAALARRYDAVTGWEPRVITLTADSFTRPPFTVEIEQLLVNQQGRPILVTGTIEDITRHGDKYDIHVSVWPPFSALRFVLECDQELAKRAMQRRAFYIPYVFVAKVTSVERAAIKLMSGLKTSEDVAPVETDVSHLFIAHGICLDLMPKDNE